MTALTEQAADAAIAAAATTLALPTVRTQAGEIADAAVRDQLTHRGYLAELLSTEDDDRAERRRIRRIREARFSRLKHLADFDTTISPIDPATIGTLAQGAEQEASPCSETYDPSHSIVSAKSSEAARRSLAV